MATDKQIAANRRNAMKSTGPKTEEGKLRARQNAFRHGLTAETVVTALENADDYARFEERITADLTHNPQSSASWSCASLPCSGGYAAPWRSRAGYLIAKDACWASTDQKGIETKILSKA